MQTVSGRKVNADGFRKEGKFCFRKVNTDSFRKGGTCRQFQDLKEDNYRRFQEGR